MSYLNLKANTPEEQIVLEHLIPQVNDSLAEKINNGVRIQKDGKTLINKKTLLLLCSTLWNKPKSKLQKINAKAYKPYAYRVIT